MTILLIVLIAMVVTLIVRDMRRGSNAKTAYKTLSQRMDAMATKKQLSDVQQEGFTALGTLNQSILDLTARIGDGQIPDAAIDTQKSITKGITDAKAALDAIAPVTPPA